MNDNTRARRTEDQLVHRISSFLPKVDLAFQWLGGVGKMSITTDVHLAWLRYSYIRLL